MNFIKLWIMLKQVKRGVNPDKKLVDDTIAFVSPFARTEIMSASCKTCCRYKKDESDEIHCELGMWGEMFGWCSHFEKKED